MAMMGDIGTRVPTVNIGNANVFQGSRITNLNQIPANSNINLVGNDDRFHLYDPTTLDNTYLYSQFESVGPTQTSIASSTTQQYVFQFNNTNWTGTRDMFLELPVTIVTSCTFDNEVSGSQTGTIEEFDPAFIDSPYTINSYPNSNSSSKTPFGNGTFPDNAILKLFRQFQVYGGTNNQPLGKTTMMDQPNLGVHSLNEKINSQQARIYGFSGLPISKVVSEQNLIGDEFKGTVSIPWKTNSRGLACFDRIDYDAFLAFEDVVRSTSTAYGSTAVRSSDFKTQSFTKNLIISIPLYKLGEWFKTFKWLPPEFKYKLTAQFYADPKVIYSSKTYVDNWTCNSSTTVKLNTALTPEIKYISYVLNPTIQESLNLKWARNMFTFSMESYEPYVVPVNSYPYRNIIIQTSQQRPLMIKIMPIAIADGIINAGLLTKTQFYTNSIVPWIDENGGPINISEIQITISGKPVLRYQNNAVDQPDNITTGYENILNSLEHNNAQGYSGQVGAIKQMYNGSFNQNQCGMPIDIPLGPGMFYDNNYYPVDQGAIQIKVDILTDKALNSKFQIVIYKLYTQQQSIDTNLKVALTEWPARVVQSGSSSVLSQPTVIPGN